MNPTTVFELHRVNRYDLILLDLQMPLMDGFTVMEALKSLEPEHSTLVLLWRRPTHDLRPGRRSPALLRNRSTRKPALSLALPSQK